MESNGIPNQIHVSQATADEIIKFGHRDWLTPRPDRVIAKGLGQMQTYFVKYKVDNSKNTNSALVNPDEFMSLFGGVFDCLYAWNK